MSRVFDFVLDSAGERDLCELYCTVLPGGLTVMSVY